jgi:hypothetical protein
MESVVTVLGGLLKFSLIVLPIFAAIVLYHFPRLLGWRVLLVTMVLSIIFIVSYYFLPHVALDAHQWFYKYDTFILVDEEIRRQLSSKVFDEYVRLSEAAGGIGWPLKVLLVSPFYVLYLLCVFLFGIVFTRMFEARKK